MRALIITITSVFDSMPVTCEKLNLQNLFPNRRDAFALIVDGLFTAEECQELIRKTEAIGYSEALLGASQIRVATQRNNWRCIQDDADLAKKLFEKIKPFVPTEWLSFPVSGLNERLRFLKYNPGEFFKPHNDGVYMRADNSQASFVTVHLYLNDVPLGSGGETTFTNEAMTYGRHSKKKRSFGVGHHELDPNATDGPRRISVQPVVGRVLIFEHHLPHEGSTLLNGTKYTLRSDIMYDLKDLKGADPAKVRLPRWGQKHPHPQWKTGSGPR